MSSIDSEFGMFFKGWSLVYIGQQILKNYIKYDTHLYLTVMRIVMYTLIHMYISIKINMHLYFRGPLKSIQKWL